MSRLDHSSFDPDEIARDYGEEDSIPPDARQFSVTWLRDVTPMPVEWLWVGRIPLGMLTLLDGDPGLGKSTLTLDLAARVSTGGAMPDGFGGGVPSGAVVLSAEDDLARTVRPRLDVAGADVSRVATVAIQDAEGTRAPVIRADDLSKLEAAILEVGARLVVVDPLMAYLPDEVNAHHDHDVRRALGALSGLAESTGAAVVIVRHLNKSSGGNSLYRGGGSIGIIAAARSALLVAPDPQDAERRILAVNKANLGQLRPALAYRLVAVPGADHAKVSWEGPTQHTAAELMEREVIGERGARDEAVRFLREMLVEPLPAKDVKALARDAGLSDATLRRARGPAGVIVHREGFGRGSRIIWSLPSA